MFMYEGHVTLVISLGVIIKNTFFTVRLMKSPSNISIKMGLTGPITLLFTNRQIALDTLTA